MSEQRRTEQSPTGQETPEQSRLEINWVNSLGGALAAVSSAVLLSTLGTAGTLIGAAIGSLVITVGGAVYAHSLRVARARLAASRTVLVRTRRGGVGEEVEVREVREEPAPDNRWRQLLSELPWKRIVVVSAAVFAVAMAAILAFELATGRPVSSYTGGTSDTDTGTTVPGIGGGEGDAEEDGGEDEPEPAPAPEEEEEVEPTEEELPAEETPAPVEEPTPSPVAPTAPAESPTG